MTMQGPLLLVGGYHLFDALQAVTVTGGTLQGTAGAHDAFGGGISTGGDLELKNAIITGSANNTAAAIFTPS